MEAVRYRLGRLNLKRKREEMGEEERDRGTPTASTQSPQAKKRTNAK